MSCSVTPGIIPSLSHLRFHLLFALSHSPSYFGVCRAALRLLTPTHVVYIMIAGWTLLTSPSAPLAGIDRRVGNEQEGNYIMAFFPAFGSKYQKITVAQYANSPMHYYYFNGMALDYYKS